MFCGIKDETEAPKTKQIALENNKGIVCPHLCYTCSPNIFTKWFVSVATEAPSMQLSGTTLVLPAFLRGGSTCTGYFRAIVSIPSLMP